jgi:hypothetical protein
MRTKKGKAREIERKEEVNTFSVSEYLFRMQSEN